MSGLLALIIGVILLVAVVAIFFLVIESIVKDALLQRIGKIVIGVLALVSVISAIWGALFGGGAGIPTGTNLIGFAVGLLIILAVVYIASIAITWFGFMVTELQYLLSLIALIAVLLVAGTTLFPEAGKSLGIQLPRISQPAR